MVGCVGPDRESLCAGALFRQALSIKHLVIGCLEGVFAMGQVYAFGLMSSCTARIACTAA